MRFLHSTLVRLMNASGSDSFWCKPGGISKHCHPWAAEKFTSIVSCCCEQRPRFCLFSLPRSSLQRAVTESIAKRVGRSFIGRVGPVAGVRCYPNYIPLPASVIERIV